MTYYDEAVETRVLKGVSFTVQEGEFVSIMGPSGSGKSTLLHILGFLERPTGGAYMFDGKSMQEYTEEELAHVRNDNMGFIFQTFNLLPRTSVLENVKLPLLYSGIKESEWDELAREAIEAVGLGHRVEYEPSQLSGGERQRVAIARALVNKPDVIFADEPTGNLDSKSGGQVMGIIQGLHEKGHTVILITHETYTAEYADRIIRVLDGNIERDEKVAVRRTGASFVK
ncbi:MAG: ABC transporter ATP-binding protein [Candidatus Yonathbacteria bacterium]|nr:ABC transporter ATP-binding protein [Candidatus Yonathbacteria bacterium]NTW47804.1 ABC transporter ATP-binding protein [Candidatus Yonathbacteria bacterium]